MDDHTIEDILWAQADRLSQGQRGFAPPERVDELESLTLLMRLAEETQRVLAPVEPSPAFVNQLGKNLVVKMSDGSREMSRRARRAALLVAAALGSVVSVVSAIGVVIYLVRQRNKRFSIQP
jgi:predicted polyphosphate/ATP-dependent NAD kinase